MSRHGAGREPRDGGDGDAVRTIGTDAAVSKSSGGRGDGPFPACQLPLKSVCREKNCAASMRFGGFSGPSAPHGPSQELSLSRHGRFGSPRTAPTRRGRARAPPRDSPATVAPPFRLQPQPVPGAHARPRGRFSAPPPFPPPEFSGYQPDNVWLECRANSASRSRPWRNAAQASEPNLLLPRSPRGARGSVPDVAQSCARALCTRALCWVINNIRCKGAFNYHQCSSFAHGGPA